MNAGLRQTLRSMTKVEADSINSEVEGKLENLKAKIARRTRQPLSSVWFHIERESDSRGIVFSIELTIAPDEKHPHGFSVQKNIRVGYNALRHITAAQQQEGLGERFVREARSLVDLVDVEYSQRINCPQFKCYGKAKRVAPAIPRQFLCERCGSHIAECPKCREVSVFKLRGVHQCEDCGWSLEIGESE